MESRTKKFTTDEITEAASLLREGELVAFPTETVYGLGALIHLESAVAKIYQVKKRPSDNPLIAHISHVNQIEILASAIPEEFYALTKAFWPGPLTIVLKRGDSTIACRQPNHEVALKLIQEVGAPLFAPSANLSGRPSSTHHDHVLEDFDGLIGGVIMGGPCKGGLESTVISLVDEPLLLRPGAISKEAIEFLLKKTLKIPQDEKAKSLSPGTRYRHYAPKGKVILFDSLEKLEAHNSPLKKHTIVPNPQNLYAELRLADQLGAEEVLILCDATIKSNLALFNRLQFASKESI